MSWFRSMSQNFTFDQLNHQADGLAVAIKDINSIQKNKLELTRVFLAIAKRKGDLSGIRMKILKKIDFQQSHVRKALGLIDRLKHYLELLVQMEQASLAIHNRKSSDDLSRMVDVFQVSMDKFEHEREQINLLENSLNILSVELQKQEDYIEKFDSVGLEDDEFLVKSDEYQEKISESDIVKVSELKAFCSDLHKMIASRKDSAVDHLTESDLAALAIRDEMLSIKIHRRIFFPISTYGFLKSIVKRSIKTRNMDKLALFLMTFLLSRLKKYKKDEYLSQLRAVIMSYNLLEHKSFNVERRDAIVGAALLANLHNLDFAENEIKDDEPRIIKQYYKTANKILAEEFPFINNIIRLHRRQTLDDPLVPWVVDGSRLLGMIYEFDREIKKARFRQESLDRKAVSSRLIKRFAKLQDAEGCIDYLLDHWHKLVPKSIMESDIEVKK